MRITHIIAPLALAMGCAAPQSQPQQVDLPVEVAEVERAFAATMAARDHAGFQSFLAADAIFMTGEEPLHGKQAVADYWERYYKGSTAPFSWEPRQVEVLESGKLALSTGPVFDPGGNVIASFTSIWRRTDSGQWEIVFDQGNPASPQQ